MRLAETFELDGRILARRGEEAAAAALGCDVVTRWVARRRDGVARALLVERLVERTASAARATGAPAVLLKGAALLVGGYGAPGTRRLADVDVLVAAADEGRLRAELLRSGFEHDGLAEPHHAPPLLDRTLGVVEVHTRLPGLAMRGGAPLDIGRLRAAGLLHPAGDGGRGELDGLLLPVPSFLAAHVATHALHQHGSSPVGYPGLRWVGDLVDLSEPAATEHSSEISSSSAVEALLGEALGTFELALSGRELDAVAAVCAALVCGAPSPTRSDADRLLRHSLAVALDEQYRGALRIRRLARSLLRDRSGLRHRVRQRAVVAARERRSGRGGRPLVGLAGRLGRDLGGWTLLRLRRRARLLS